jgi:uncharacterized protein YjeT (DUF2065 family)
MDGIGDLIRWRDLGIAIALVLVFEGILPFLNPAGLRRTLQMLMNFTDTQLRIAGAASMFAGLVLLTIMNR